MKVATIVGARPQFIKAAAVSRVLRTRSQMDETLIHTGQHYDENMSDVFFEELEIPKPNFHLGIGSGTHGLQTGRMLEAIERILLETTPDWVLIYGDTNSTLAGALAAVKLHIAVAHVEAGLRSFNRNMPEEINRVLTDHASELLFAPTEAAKQNLEREGISPGKVRQVGDVMYDAALFYGDKAGRHSRILQRLNLKVHNYVLATVHRAENTDDPIRLQAIFGGFATLAKEIPIVVSLHPRTREALERVGLRERLSRDISFIDPVGYLDMAMLEKNALLVATDSGGVQKEAFFYRVPCATLRDETEWVELVQAGWNTLVPPISSGEVCKGIREALGKQGAPIQPYGDGDAVPKILESLLGSQPSGRSE
jgi:UDP-GlcNAc3NAcA epimerase